MQKTLITKIVRDSVLDGPGCRYVVFVKGCHLRCPWCHNPETQNQKQEIFTYPQFCIKCGKCAQTLGEKNISLPIKINNENINPHHACVAACPTGALEYVAKEYSTEFLINDLFKFNTIYKKTKGGLTISGGEPLLVNLFSRELLSKAKGKNIHTAIDTTLAFSWKIIQPFLKLVDLWLVDIKHSNDHELLTDQVAENLKKIAQIKNTKIWIRIPIIPNYNDNENEWLKIIQIILPCKNAIKKIDLLPFHALATDKYTALGREFKYKNTAPLDESVLKDAAKIFKQHLPKIQICLGRRLIQG